MGTADLRAITVCICCILSILPMVLRICILIGWGSLHIIALCGLGYTRIWNKMHMSEALTLLKWVVIYLDSHYNTLVTVVIFFILRIALGYC